MPKSERPEQIHRPFIERVREVFEGVPEGQGSWITSGGPEGGLNGSLAGLSAAQASRQLAGTTVAAHAEHVRWLVSKVNAFLRDEKPAMDWSESWAVTTVDEAAWNKLRTELRKEGTELLANIEKSQDWGGEAAANGAISTYGHIAYHLGAIRQLRKLTLAG